MAEFQTDNFKLAQPIISDTVLWTPPIMSLYRINIRVIIRNHTGQVEAALSKKLPIPLGPLETKAKALKEGVYYAWDVGKHDIVFESVSKIVVDALNGISEASVSINIISVGIRNKLSYVICISKTKITQLIFRLNMPKNIDGYVTQIEKDPNMVEYTLVHDVLFLSSS